MSMVEEEIKLNIGAGCVDIPGYTPIDRKLGTEAYPLPQYTDNSVDEIRASHILEHFPFAEVPNVLAEWVRALKPGGTIKIAVPDIAKIDAGDPKAPFYLMGI
jgi:predicted SAM-dependent methyltransferase